MRTLATFAAGLAAGILGTLAVHATLRLDPAVPAAPEIREIPSPADGVAPPSSASTPRADACAQQLEQLTLQNALLRGQLERLGGGRIEWPPDVHAAFQPDAVRAWLAEAGADLPDIEMLELDCDEFPCIAFFRYADGLPADSRTVDPLREGFQTRSEGLGLANVHVFGTQQGAYAALSFGPLEPDGERPLQERLKVRVEQLAEVHLPQ